MTSDFPQVLGLKSLMDAKAGRDAPGMKSPTFQENRSGARRGAWGSRWGVLGKAAAPAPSLPPHLQVHSGHQAAASEVAVWPVASPVWGESRLVLASLGPMFPAGWLQPRGHFPKNRPHVRCLGPVGLRSIAISFQDITHKKAPGIVWLQKSSQDSKAGMTCGYTPRSGQGSLVCHPLCATQAGT